MPEKRKNISPPIDEKSRKEKKKQERRDIQSDWDKWRYKDEERSQRDRHDGRARKELALAKLMASRRKKLTQSNGEARRSPEPVSSTYQGCQSTTPAKVVSPFRPETSQRIMSGSREYSLFNWIRPKKAEKKRTSSSMDGLFENSFKEEQAALQETSCTREIQWPSDFKTAKAVLVVIRVLFDPVELAGLLSKPSASQTPDCFHGISFDQEYSPQECQQISKKVMDSIEREIHQQERLTKLGEYIVKVLQEVDMQDEKPIVPLLAAYMFLGICLLTKKLRPEEYSESWVDQDSGDAEEMFDICITELDLAIGSNLVVDNFAIETKGGFTCWTCRLKSPSEDRCSALLLKTGLGSGGQTIHHLFRIWMSTQSTEEHCLKCRSLNLCFANEGFCNSPENLVLSVWIPEGGKSLELPVDDISLHAYFDEDNHAGADYKVKCVIDLGVAYIHFKDKWTSFSDVNRVEEIAQTNGLSAHLKGQSHLLFLQKEGED